MNDAVILNCRRLPGRVDVDDTARLLGFQPHDIVTLMRARLLRPLGNPVPNAHKYFAAAELEELSRDRAWLEKATRAIAQHWRERNQRQGPG